MNNATLSSCRGLELGQEGPLGGGGQVGGTEGLPMVGMEDTRVIELGRQHCQSIWGMPKGVSGL